MKRQKVLVRGIICGCLAWFALWACAPMMSAPPAPPMAEAMPRELGAGLSAGVGLYSDEMDGPIPVVNIDSWMRFHINDRNQMGGLASIGMGSIGIAGGGYYRYSLLADGQSNVGIEVSGGWLWLGAHLPMAFALSDGRWLTTKPGVQSYSGIGMVQLPVGLSWQVGKTGRWDTELGLSFEGFWGDYVPYGAFAYSKGF